MKKVSLFCVAVAACWVAVGAHAQPQPPGVAVAEMMSKIFGDHKAFTAKMTTTVETKEFGEVTTDVSYSMLDGNVRAEVDMNSVKGVAMNEAVMMQLKMVGMDRTYTLIRNDKKTVFVVFPNIEACLKVPMGQPRDGETPKPPTLETTKLGEEKVGDRDCVKNRMVFTSADGSKQEFIVWSAPSLKNFPVKTEGAQTDGSRFSATFSDVNFDKPDAKTFEPPANFKEFATMMELMGAAMQKMMQPPQQTAPQPKQP